MQRFFTAKGDLLGGTGPDAAARLAVGTDGLPLVADSTQAVGFKWGIAAAMLTKPWQTGRYYFTPNGITGTSVVLANGTLRAIPFWVPNAVTISRIGGECTLAGDAASVLRLGIYADDGTGRPGALVIDAGTISGFSATVQEITISQALTPGIYYAAGVVQGVTVTQPTIRINASASLIPVDAHTSMPAANASPMCFFMAGVTAGLPAFTVAGTTGSQPRIFMKVA